MTGNKMRGWFSGIVVIGLTLTLLGQPAAGSGPLYFSAGSSNSWDNGVTQNWSGTSGGVGGVYTDAFWSDASDAYFEGTAAAVNVLGAIPSVNSITFSTDGYTLSGGGITLTGPGGTIATGSGTDTINSQLGGTVGLTKLGPGTLVLSSVANTYNGGTTVAGGVLQITNSNWSHDANTGTTLPGGSYTLAGGTLALDYGMNWGVNNNVTLTANSTIYIPANDQTNLQTNNTISGPGKTLTKDGPGVLFINTPNVTLGAIYVAAGLLGADGRNGGGGNWGGGGTTVTVANGGTLGPWDYITLPNPIVLNGGTGIAYNGGGGAATFSGPVTLNATTSLDATNGNLTFSSAIAGSGGLTAVGGTLILSGSNTYTGATTINGGTLQIGDGGGTGTLGSGPVINNAALSFSRNDARLTVANAIGGSGSLAQIGVGMTTLSGSNSYTGGTTINAGVLEVSTTAALPSYNVAGKLSVAAGATLALAVGGPRQWNSATTDDIGNLLAANSGSFIAGSMLGIDTTGGSFTYAHALAGSIGLNKLGANTLSLTGTNTYSGGTTINAGVLEVSTTAALPSYNVAGKLSVAAGATLALAVGGPGQWNSGASDDLGSLLANNGGNFAAGSKLGIDTTGGSFTYAGVITGPMGLTKLGGGNLTLTAANSYTGLTTISAGTLTAGYTTSNNNSSTFNATTCGGITIGPSGTLVAPYSGSIFGWATVGTNTTQNWPTITVSGLMIDTANANVNLGPLTLSGGTMAAIGTGDPWGTWNINNDVSVTADSLISASAFDLGGNQDPGQRTFTVNPGVTLNVTGYFRNGGGEQNTVYGLILNGGGTMILSGADTYTGGTIVEAGTLILTNNTALADGTSLTVGAGGTSIFGDSQAGAGLKVSAPGAQPMVAAVPEPGTLAMLAAALCGAVACRRFSRRLESSVLA